MNMVVNQGFMKSQSYMRPCSKVANGLTIHIKALKKLIEAGRLLNVVVLFVLFVCAPVGVVVGKPCEMLWLEFAQVDLFEVLDIDSTIILMEFKKGFVTFIVFERHPWPISL